MKYYRASNNGVVAVMTALTYEEIKRQSYLAADIGWDQVHALHEYPLPIFTFVRDEQYDAETAKYVTGPLSLLDRMVHKLPGVTVETGDFYVPFSNSFERSHYASTRDAELKYRTTTLQCVEAFGLVSSALVHRAS